MSIQDRGRYDIRSILSEMKDEYWQGLAGNEELEDERLECVSFLLGGEIYAFETIYASEVIRVPKLVRLPRVQDVIVGVFNLRGEILAAIDIRPMLGLPQPQLGSAARIIVVKSERFSTGLITEGIKGVDALSMESFEPAVKSLSGSQKDFIRGQLPSPAGLVMLLDVLKLMASPEIVVNN
jgi:purine-binding chemotaxis protein CheW